MKRVIALSAALSLFASTALATQFGPPVGPGGGGGGGGGTPGGSNGQLQYNNSGAFGGATIGTGLSFSGGTLSTTGAGTGTVTSIATACGVAGGTITTTGTVQSALTANNVSTAGAYAFLATDCGALVRFTDSVSRAPTLNVALFSDKNFINLKNDGTGTQTITPSAGTINGAATYALVPGAGVTIAYNLTNTNWIISQTAMIGPASAVAGHVATYSGTSGQILADGGAPATVTSVTCAGATTITTSGTCPDGPHPNYNTSRFFAPIGLVTANSASVAPTANIIRCTYGGIPRKGTVGSVGHFVSTVDAAGNYQEALYADTGTGLPGALLTNTGNISTAASGTTGAFSPSVQIGPGGANGSDDVWWCFNTSSATAVFNAVAIAIGLSPNYIGGSSVSNTVSSSAGVAGISCSGANCNGGSSTFNTWPATLAGSTWTDITSRAMPIPAFQFSSVP